MSKFFGDIVENDDSYDVALAKTSNDSYHTFSFFL